MVCRRAGGRLAGLRVRGERRRFAAAPRRQRLDDGQGRHHAGPARGEITARTGKDPSQLYSDLTAKLGNPAYERVDAPADAAQRKALSKLSGEQITSATLAGEKIESVLTKAPGNGAAIGGVKVVTASAGSRRALGDREHLQDLCGKRPRAGTPEADIQRSRADRGCALAGAAKSS